MTPDPEESARRLRAAIAYVGIDYERAAKAVGVSKETLSRMLGRKGSETRPATWDDLWRFASEFGLPKAWFAFDISRLQEIVPDDMPRFPNDTGVRQ